MMFITAARIQTTAVPIGTWKIKPLNLFTTSSPGGAASCFIFQQDPAIVIAALTSPSSPPELSSLYLPGTGRVPP